MVPGQINAIINKMLEHVTHNETLTFIDFRKWLDMNPTLRTIIQDALRPNLWTIPNQEKPVMKLGKHENKQVCFQNRIQGDFSAKAFSELETDERNGRKTLRICNQRHDYIRKQGELVKIGKKTNMLVKRYYVVKDGALLIYTHKGNVRPHSKH